MLKKTPGGKPSTAEPVLVDLAQDYELPATILQYRGLAKLKSTYTDKLPLDINADTGRIHTSYHQAVAATGRLSSSDKSAEHSHSQCEGRRTAGLRCTGEKSHYGVGLLPDRIENNGPLVG